MTEKRFIQSRHWCIDRIKKRRTEYWDTVINWLNELNEENKQLEQAFIKLKHRHSLLYDVCLDTECDKDMYHKDVLSLKKENEQLKQELFEISKELLWATSDEVDRVLYYEDEVEELRKEIFE